MHDVRANVGLLKKNKKKPISRNRQYKNIKVTDLLHPTVICLTIKKGFLRDYLSSNEGCVQNPLQLCNSSLYFSARPGFNVVWNSSYKLTVLEQRT